MIETADMKKYDVFISYSRKDMGIADQLCVALDNAGISYWIDRNIHGSANFLTEITQCIRNCKVVLFIASANSAASPWAQKEILFALKHQKEIVPYRIGEFSFDDSDELDLVFTNVQWVESEQNVIESLQALGVYCSPSSPTNKSTTATKTTSEPTDAKELYELGVKYYNKGEYAEAAKLFRKAAEQGNARAQFNLGYCYEKGQGVEQNYTEAVKWYRMAAEQGNENAKNNLSSLASHYNLKR